MVPGLESHSPVDVAVAAMMQGGVSRKRKLVISVGVTLAAMSCMFGGKSSKKRSTAQSDALHGLAVRLHVSLRMCWPSFAEEW